MHGTMAFTLRMVTLIDGLPKSNVGGILHGFGNLVGSPLTYRHFGTSIKRSVES